MRSRKLAALAATLVPPVVHGDAEGDLLAVGWGSTLGAIEEAVDRLRAQGRRVSSLHLRFLSPLEPGLAEIFARFRRVVTIEMNYSDRPGDPLIAAGTRRTGQLAQLLMSARKMQAGLESLRATVAGVLARMDAPVGDLKALFVKSAPEPVRRYWERERPLELRPVDLRHYLSRDPLEPGQQVWLRATAPLPDDPGIHRSVLAYASDMTLLDTALAPHGRTLFEKEFMAASLDHALWLHRPFRADDWLLYAQDTPNLNGARGFSRGLIFRRDGALVASVAQEGLIRVRRAEA